MRKEKDRSWEVEKVGKGNWEVGIEKKTGFRCRVSGVRRPRTDDGIRKAEWGLRRVQSNRSRKKEN